MLFEDRQRLVRWSAVNVVDVPILDPLGPLREMAVHQGPVLGLLHGDDQLRLAQVASRDLAGWPIVLRSRMPRAFKASTVKWEMGPMTPQSSTAKPHESARQGSPRDGPAS